MNINSCFCTLLFSVFDLQYLHSMTSYFGVCIFCPDHDFYDFFFTHRTFFLLRQRGPNDWEMCIYLLSHAWKSRVVFWKIWNVSMVTISSPPIRLPDTNTHVVNSVVLADWSPCVVIVPSPTLLLGVCIFEKMSFGIHTFFDNHNSLPLCTTRVLSLTSFNEDTIFKREKK